MRKNKSIAWALVLAMLLTILPAAAFAGTESFKITEDGGPSTITIPVDSVYGNPVEQNYYVADSVYRNNVAWYVYEDEKAGSATPVTLKGIKIFGDGQPNAWIFANADENNSVTARVYEGDPERTFVITAVYGDKNYDQIVSIEKASTKSNDASISELRVCSMKAESGDEKTFNVTLPAGTDLDSVEATDFAVKAADKAIVAQVKENEKNANEWTVDVTAENGDTVTYTIDVAKEAEAELTDKAFTIDLAGNDFQAGATFVSVVINGKKVATTKDRFTFDGTKPMSEIAKDLVSYNPQNKLGWGYKVEQVPGSDTKVKITPLAEQYVLAEGVTTYQLVGLGGHNPSQPTDTSINPKDDSTDSQLKDLKSGTLIIGNYYVVSLNELTEENAAIAYEEEEENTKVYYRAENNLWYDVFNESLTSIEDLKNTKIGLTDDAEQFDGLHLQKLDLEDK